jgi:hypothetical protein
MRAWHLGSSWLAVAALVWVAAAPVAAQLGRATRPQVTLPQGPTRHVILDNCTSCHGIDDYAYSALTRDGWDAYLTAMHRGMDVRLAADDRDVLLDWLAERFGPGTNPFPCAYVPPEITTFFMDAEAEVFIARTCTTCHPVDRVNDGRHTAERWRAIVVDMRERGAVIGDTELERLVEWLGRVQGTNDSDRQ